MEAAAEEAGETEGEGREREGGEREERGRRGRREGGEGGEGVIVGGSCGSRWLW